MKTLNQNTYCYFKDLYCYLVPARGSLKVATSRCTIFVSTQKIWL